MNAADGSEHRLASSSELVRCMRCDCTFKRLEHLRRHERIHDAHKRFACSQCSKSFTRSDILRRHETTHAPIETANGARQTRNRACTECARSRGRCSKSNPCQRCSARGLHCAYPPGRAKARNQHPRLDQCPLSRSPLGRSQSGSLTAGILGDEAMTTCIMSDRPLGRLAEAEAPNEHVAFTGYRSSEGQGGSFEIADSIIPEFHGNQVMEPTMDFPMNWLPPDNSIAIDYDSIVGLGISSLDFFSIPATLTDVTSSTATMQHDQGEAVANVDANAPANLSLYPSAIHQQSPTWTLTSPAAMESHVSSDSPHSATHTISPSAAPGGLYSTSINGARMPCTVRARRRSRLIPRSTPIKPISRYRMQDDFGSLEFPDTSHIIVDQIVSPASPGLHYAPTLTITVYEDMLRKFSRLCLSESSVFQAYTNTRYPSLPTLNMFIQLYFENFDDIVPILHDEVTRINDHWLLAVAVCAVGCQYAEADEFSRSVEPLHEFLRRAITVELTGLDLPIAGRNEQEIALAQSMTLNQIGMLYFGSSKLLQFARAQHSALIELARSLAFTTLPPSTSRSEFDSNSNVNTQDIEWRRLLFEESKRRIGYAIWLLDCMAAYHFLRQPLMPPNLVPVALPNDKLWLTRSSEDWSRQPASAHETPSLSCAVVSLFREKQVATCLDQFSRIVLLHGIHREIFHLKDCFAGPLGNWVPSIQHADMDAGGPRISSDPAPGGRSLLNSWRNAALDCVDVLHWAANGTIAMQAGAEHPTVLHLHLSRTILLAPFGPIQTLADLIVSFAEDPSSKALGASIRKQVIDSERDILEWAQRDQCKARLAVLHSGCLFWHVRRYSCRAFYEPISVFLATLTIWAYSSYASRTSGFDQSMPDRSSNEGEGGFTNRSRTMEDSSASHGAGVPPSPASDDSEPAPTFIHLDRPNDDEMVQAFVRFGTSTVMRANITGVGDIYSPRGPARVLREGQKILATVSTAWGRTEKYVSVLEILEQVALGRMTL